MKRVEFRGDRVHSLVTLRPALHGALLAAVGDGSVLLGRRVEAVVESDVPGVTLADGSHLEATLLVGADGVASAVRRRLHPQESPPRPSGYHALRGVTLGAGAALGTADAAVYLADGVEIGFARASASSIYWYVSLIDRFASTEPAEVLERCMRGIDGRAAEIARGARPEDLRLDRLFYRAPLPHWGRGRVTLLGDAAHPVLPHTAQGAALALEDAVALGLALSGSSDLDAALRRYERLRSARTRPVVRIGPRIAANTTPRSRARRIVRDAIVRLIPARVLPAMLSLHARDPHRPLRSAT